MSLPLMLKANIVPLLYEYDVERKIYENYRAYNFFDFYTTLQFLRDSHSERIAFNENLNEEIRRLEEETDGLEEWDDDYDEDEEPITKDDCDDYWEDDDEEYDFDD